ncbi:MAG: hypothetical protein AAB817_01780 [Patescibacteria group bacterium]
MMVFTSPGAMTMLPPPVVETLVVDKLAACTSLAAQGRTDAKRANKSPTDVSFFMRFDIIPV